MERLTIGTQVLAMFHPESEMKNIFSLFGLLLSVTCSAQEQWTYTGFHPWYWLPSEDTWVYVPSQPQYVWNATTNNWVLNPMSGSSSFNVTDVVDASPLVIQMAVEGGEPMVLTVNLSGQEGGFLTLGALSIPISYRYSSDAVKGRIQLFGTGDGDLNAFSVLLDFDSVSSGRYTLIGDLGFSSCSLCEFSGSFVVE